MLLICWCILMANGERTFLLSSGLLQQTNDFYRLGRLEPSDAPVILDLVYSMNSEQRPFDPENTPPLSTYHWRGRMGLSKEAQKEMYARAIQSLGA